MDIDGHTALDAAFEANEIQGKFDTIQYVVDNALHYLQAKYGQTILTFRLYYRLNSKQARISIDNTIC